MSSVPACLQLIQNVYKCIFWKYSENVKINVGILIEMPTFSDNGGGFYDCWASEYIISTNWWVHLQINFRN